MPETPAVTEVQPIDESRIPSDLAGFTKWRQTGELMPETPAKPAPATEVKTVEGAEPSKEEQELAEQKERDEKGRFKTLSDDEQLPAETPEHVQKAVNKQIGKLKGRYEAEIRELKQRLANPQETAKPAEVKETAKPTLDDKPTTAKIPPELVAKVKDIGEHPEKYGLTTWEDVQIAQNLEIQHFNENDLRQKLRAEIKQELQEAETLREIAETDRQLPGFKKSVDLVMATFRDNPECAEAAHIVWGGPWWKEATHHLGTHPEELAKLVELVKTDRIEAIATAVGIRNKFTGQAKATPAPEPKPRVTQAPPPPQPVNARATGAFDVNDETMNADEWAARRTAERKARGFAY